MDRESRRLGPLPLWRVGPAWEPDGAAARLRSILIDGALRHLLPLGQWLPLGVIWPALLPAPARLSGPSALEVPALSVTRARLGRMGCVISLFRMLRGSVQKSRPDPVSAWRLRWQSGRA